MLNPSCGRQWINPSKRLVDKAIDRWNFNNLRADNTSVVTVMLDPPGPPRAQVLKKQREQLAANVVTSERGSVALVTNQEAPNSNPESRPGFSIISRFPNASNLRERNLNETASTSKVLHDFQRGPLSRLSNSTKLANNKVTSTTENEENLERKISDASTLVINPENSEKIQCNEISSSEDEDEERRNTVEMTPKLSRELSALQLSSSAWSPGSGSGGRSRSRTRTGSQSDNESDTENEAPRINEKKRQDLNIGENKFSHNKPETEEEIINPHFLRSREAKIKKAATVHLSHLSGSSSSPTTVMSLRPRPQSMVSSAGSATASPNRKRKPENLFSQNSLNGGVVCKSPKLMPTVIQSAKPVMTRSRTARVLHLKK